MEKRQKWMDTCRQIVASLAARAKDAAEAMAKWMRANRPRLGRIGYYAALACLLALLGSASYAYRSQSAISESVGEAPVAAPTAMPAIDVFLPNPTPQTPAWVWPLAGEIIGGYAPVTPVWSATLSQWQTHPAVDIAGNPGEAVCACADGVVADAWQDAMWGDVVVIDHGDGYRSTYANLNTLSLVRAGDAVSAGDVISAVGQTAACESEMPWHLHFALEKDGEPVDFEALMQNAAE